MENNQKTLKVQIFYIEDVFLEAAIGRIPEGVRDFYNESAWRKMGFICNDGSSFLTYITESGLRKVIITETGTLFPEKKFHKYLKQNIMIPHLVDNDVSISV